ncbi:MAG: hypothetical protein JXB48_11660 [Candidatus Latescibacteria bacterium]|nr:hypothetical protein [Candidatus Latescibacterota bacterium]
MHEEMPYHTIPDPPDTITGLTVLIRLIDGLGFRFRWATEGLRGEDCRFKPDPRCMSIKELIEHIWGLVNWIRLSITGIKQSRPEEVHFVRKSILDMIVELRRIFLSMSEDDLNEIRIHDHSFWHIINGPLSDALTHVGQINILRRLSGNPTPDVNVFTGKPNF